MTTYQLIQDGMVVAEVSGPEEDAKREIAHYAMVYSQDNLPVEIKEVKEE